MCHGGRLGWTGPGQTTPMNRNAPGLTPNPLVFCFAKSNFKGPSKQPPPSGKPIIEVGGGLRFPPQPLGCDDVFFVTGRAAQARPLFLELSRRAQSCWKLKVDMCSLVGVPMLDVFLYKGGDFASASLLSHHPYIKPSAKHIPLSHTSIHNWSVHRSWPVSEIARMHELSLSKLHFEHFRSLKVARFRKFLMLESIVQQCLAWAKPKVREARTPPAVLLRIVNPFHPGLRHLGHSLRDVVQEWAPELARVWRFKGDHSNGKFMDIQVSFSSAGLALAVVCRRLHL